MLKTLFNYRYVVLLSSLFLYHFDSLFFSSSAIIDQYIQPLNTILVILASLILFWKARFFAVMATIAGIDILFQLLGFFGYATSYNNEILSLLNMFYFGAIILRVFRDLYTAKEVNFNILMGTFSGLILLGIIGFALFIGIESAHPNSFKGLEDGGTNQEDLFYFSYISILTVGYGDITPLTPLARRATIFILLISNFYTLIITALVIGKYLGQQSLNKNKKHSITD